MQLRHESAIGVTSYVQAVDIWTVACTSDGHEVIWSNFTNQMIVSASFSCLIIAAAVFSLLKAGSLEQVLFSNRNSAIIVRQWALQVYGG